MHYPRSRAILTSGRYQSGLPFDRFEWGLTLWIHNESKCFSKGGVLRELLKLESKNEFCSFSRGRRAVCGGYIDMCNWCSTESWLSLEKFVNLRETKLSIVTWLSPTGYRCDFWYLLSFSSCLRATEKRKPRRGARQLYATSSENLANSTISALLLTREQLPGLVLAYW
jgi:hypothetical protein